MALEYGDADEASAGAFDIAGGRAGVSGAGATVGATEGATVDDAADTEGADAAAATVPRSQGFGGEGVAIA